MNAALASLLSLALRLLYWPVCRAYSKTFVRDKPADSFLSTLCCLQFVVTYKYWPNFRTPRRFSEKLWARMLYDRQTRLTLISDKLRVRDYVAGKVGKEYLIPLLWEGDSPENIPFDELPDRFVIKTNHGSGYIILVPDKKRIDRRQVRNLLGKWLKVNFGRDTYLGIAWGYNHIRPTIMIESFVGGTDIPPIDYKFYCFGGHVEVATLHFDRFGVHRTRSYDRNFLPHEFKYCFDQWAGEFLRPPTYDAMVKIAEALSSEFDFMRVDLYSVDHSIYFSELTPYPGGINTPFLPASQDRMLGEKWPDKWSIK